MSGIGGPAAILFPGRPYGSAMNLEEDVLARIKPTAKEVDAVREAASQLMERLARAAKERDIPATPRLMGSVAKDTFLKDPEIDVFLTFPETTPRADLERWGLELGETLDAPTRRYAEHPYTRGRFGAYEADVVPCYALQAPSDRMTAVDRTPFHLTYVREHLEEAQRDEVRLLKRFLKGIGGYGAEARVQGFSGYLCELLVLRYGTFRETLEAAREWRPQVALALDTPGTREFDEPLVFVDPVDGERNAASAVSLDTLATFTRAAWEYLEAPDPAFFFPPDEPVWDETQLREALARRGSTVLAVLSAAPELSEDVLYPQLWKAEHAARTYLEDEGFRVLRSQALLREDAWTLLIEMEVARLPSVRKHRGPPAWLRNAAPFLRKWEAAPSRLSGPYVERGRLVVDVVRDRTEAAEALEAALPDLSLGRNLDEAVRQGFELLQGEELLGRGLDDVLGSFLRRSLPWKIRPSSKR